MPDEEIDHVEQPPEPEALRDPEPTFVQAETPIVGDAEEEPEPVPGETEVFAIAIDGIGYKLTSIGRNHFGVHAFVNEEVWETLSAKLPSKMIHGQDETNTGYEYEALVTENNIYVVRESDREKVPD